MKSHIVLLQLELFLQTYQFALLSLCTAFVTTLISIPPVISYITKHRLFDIPNHRKLHLSPIPTMGGIAIFAGMMVALMMWFPFRFHSTQLCFFFSVTILFVLGIFDDLKDLPARYKFVVQLSLAAMIALSGIRISSFEGLFGIYELPVAAQYTITILAITGITNAFNLIDGIDGLAGGLGFMSLVTLGIFLTISDDANTALIAFALSGAVLAFLYFNLNPARIFMGDTGSLILGFITSVLCIRLIQVNGMAAVPVLPNAPVFVMGIVLIPVFDTIRVFSFRIWRGKSPFEADKTHIHHLLTRQDFSHGLSARIICVLHGLFLFQAFSIRFLSPGLQFVLLLVSVTLATLLLTRTGILLRFLKSAAVRKLLSR